MAARTVSSSSSSVDSFSSLPDEILAQVLSFLPTKQAASTSILSKRWRDMFQLMNLLCASFVFNVPDDDGVQNSFRDFVDKTLFFSNSPLKRFSLNFQDDVHHIGRTTEWISKALERGVSDLDLRIRMMPRTYKTPDLLLPKRLYVNNTLVKLTLGSERCLGSSLLVNFDLPLLKSLSLYTVWCSDMWFITTGCPQLEELYIHHTFIQDRESCLSDVQPEPVYIAHDNIKKITIHYQDHVTYSSYVIFMTPNLIYLDYADYLTSQYYSEWGYFSEPNAFSALFEARLDLMFCPRGRLGTEHQNCSQLMSYICDVQILHISSYTAKVMYDCLDYWRSHGGFPLFKNLTTLHLECSQKHWKILFNFIETSPKLETLVLTNLYGINDKYGVVNIGENVVKVVEIQGYKGRVGELNQVKCLLWELENLEEIKVKIVVKKNQLRLTNDLLALPKRSSKCNIHVL